MKSATIFERFWESYSTENPNAKRIYDLLTDQGERIVHDHIALRTFDDPRMHIDVIARVFTDNGYEARGEYDFRAKKLQGRHFEHKEVNEFVKRSGYIMNTAAGEIYGTPVELLEQSATMAEIVPFVFADGVYDIPSCFYEFTLRYNDPDGREYSGFIAANADKIFESTNYYQKQAGML